MKTSSIVTITHFVIVSCLMFFNGTIQKKTIRKPISVHTYTVQSSEIKDTEPKRSESVSPLPVDNEKTHKTALVKQTENVKPLITKKSLSQNRKNSEQKPTAGIKKPDKPSNLNDKKLIQLMQKSLSSCKNISSNPVVSSGESPNILASEALFLSSNYEEFLIKMLEKSFVLPEKGSVKISLTINRAGVITNNTIYESDSVRNQSYIRRKMENIIAPPFDKAFHGEKEHTFLIVLKSHNR